MKSGSIVVRYDSISGGRGAGVDCANPASIDTATRIAAKHQRVTFKYLFMSTTRGRRRFGAVRRKYRGADPGGPCAGLDLRHDGFLLQIDRDGVVRARD